MKTINSLCPAWLKQSILGASIASFGAIPTAFADSDANKKALDEALERIDELEEAIWSLEEKVGDRAVAQAFDGIRLDIGGFFHSTYTSVDAEDGSTQSFNRQNFELLIGAELAESWSAFFAGGYLRESGDGLSIGGNRTNPEFNAGPTNNPLIIGWVNYEHSNLLNVRVGRMITPHGIINIEHFPATLLDPEQPQFLRPFGSDTIFPNFATGIQFHGNKFYDSFGVEYAAYWTNRTSTDENLYGGRLAFSDSDKTVTLGLNFSDGNRLDNDNSEYDLFGVDLLLELDKFQLKTEYYLTDEDLPGDQDREAFYIQPAYRITPKWTAFIRFDELDLGDNAGESTEYVYGVNYVPVSQVRLRAIYTEREYEGGSSADADADIFQISGTFSF